MKHIMTLAFLFSVTIGFAQVQPSSGTQSSLTGGATTTNMTPADLSEVSMQDLDRFNGSYSNGYVEALGDNINIRCDGVSELQFSGTVVSASVDLLTLDGVDKSTGNAMILNITVAPDNNGKPKKLYVIESGNSKWILTEDPLNPK